jgi:uncharacterized protein (TIGR02145 family)
MKKLMSIQSIAMLAIIGTMVFFSSCEKDEEPETEMETFTDSRDGNVYNIVEIGNQTWMAENFAYKPADGFWAYNNDESNVSTYGYLYTIDTAISICPDGWHVPSIDEWEELFNYLGGTEQAGNKMKEAGGAHWDSEDYGNKNITNSSGFTALPGGYWDDTFDEFNYLGLYGFWWTETGAHALLTGNYVDAEIQNGGGSGGYSVRYIKD